MAFKARVLNPLAGGTGIANNDSSTLAISGAFAATFTLTNTTSVTFPTSGTLATTSQIPSLPLSAASGGTGVANNAASTLTISGNFGTTLTVTGVTGVTLPTSGTLATTSQLTSGTVTNVTGTTNQVSVATGNTTPVISLVGPYTPATYTAHGVLFGAGTSSIGATTAGTSGQVLRSQGASADPTWTTATFPATATGTGTILRSDGTNWVASTPTYPNAASTAGKVVVSDGTNLIMSTPTFPNASATTRKIIVSDGTNWTASTETYAVPGTSGNVMTSDGTNWTSAAASGSSFAPNSTINLFDDFIGWLVASTVNFTANLQWFFSGLVTLPPTALITQTASNPGVVVFAGVNTGQPDQGLFLYGQATNTTPTFILGGGAISVNWVMKIGTLSTATNRYTIRCGLGTTAGADQVNGCYFEYSDNLNSGNWVGKTAKASVRTSANSAVAATTTGYHNFGITINAAGTSVAYFIDGVQIANSPIAANIPVVAITPFIDLVWTAGTSPSPTMLIDLFYMTQSLTTPR